MRRGRPGSVTKVDDHDEPRHPMTKVASKRVTKRKAKIRARQSRVKRRGHRTFESSCDGDESADFVSIRKEQEYDEENMDNVIGSVSRIVPETDTQDEDRKESTPQKRSTLKTKRANRKYTEEKKKVHKVVEVGTPADVLSVQHLSSDALKGVFVRKLRHTDVYSHGVLCLETTPCVEGISDYVAASRENGCVELCSPDEKWNVVARVAGSPLKPVDVMAWAWQYCGDDNTDGKGQAQAGITNEMADDYSSSTELSYFAKRHEIHYQFHANLSLVGASRDGSIFIVDMARGCLDCITQSDGGGVFALERLCNDRAQHDDGKGAFRSIVAAGCEDGSVRLFRVEKQPGTVSLVLLSTVRCSTSSSVLSLAFLCNGPTGKSLDGTIMFTGMSDGSIRRYDCQQRDRSIGNTDGWRPVVRMTLDSFGNDVPARVWDLKVLSDGTVISSDSYGNVEFWDGQTGLLTSTFSHSEADVFTLAVNQDETHVFAAGVDPKIMLIQRRLHSVGDTMQPSGQRGSHWILAGSRKPHSHDVKALALCRLQDLSGCLGASCFGGEKNFSEILCSAGIDSVLCTTRIDDFVKTSYHKIRNRFSPKVCLAKEPRLFAILHDKEIQVHKVEAQENESTGTDETLFGRIRFKTSSNLVCADLSRCGTRIVATDGSFLVVYDLQFSKEDDKDGMEHLIPVQVPLAAFEADKSAFYLSANFLSRERIACTTNKGMIRILEVKEAEEDRRSQVVLLQEITNKRKALFHGTKIVASDDGTWFAVSSGCVGSPTTRIFRWNDSNYVHWWSLPSLESPLTTMLFLNVNEFDTVELFVACCNFAPYIFNVTSRTLSKWSETNGIPVTPRLPDELMNQQNNPFHCIRNGTTSENMFLVSHGSLTRLDTSTDLQSGRNSQKGRKKQKLRKELPIVRFDGALFMDFLSRDELLVIHMPREDVVAALPESLDRKLYGT